MIYLVIRLVLVVTCFSGTTACTRLTTDTNRTGSAFGTGEVFGELRARYPTERASSEPHGLIPIDGRAGTSLNFAPESSRESATSESAAAGFEGAADAGNYLLNFENAEIKDVVRAILRDTLGLNYTMSANVGGQITISSVRPVGRDELLSILEIILAGEGLLLTHTKAGYRIAPSGVGGGVVDRGTRAQPSYGISVVPLRFVSVGTMTKLLNGFVVDPEGLQIHVAENAVVVRGAGVRRHEVVKAILSFDADWMHDQSVSIFEIRRATPEAIVTELERIFSSREGGTAAGLIEFKPITRLRAIMVVSKNPKLIQRAETWVRRLDQASATAAKNVFVYRARYRDAKELARIVSALFVTGGGATADPAVKAAPEARSDLTGSTFGVDTNKDGFVDAPEGGAAVADPTSKSNLDENSLIAGSKDGDDRVATAFDIIDLTHQRASGSTSIKISAYVGNNSVITYTDGETYEKILATLRQLDSTPLQIAINVTFAEVRLNDQLQYGVQYFVKSGDVGLGAHKGSIGLFSQAAATLQKQIPGFNFVAGSDASPDVIISALDEISDVEVLSSPSLVVLENQTATLQVGDQVPITVRQAQSLGDVEAPLVNQIEFRDTGIILNVTPRIGQNDAVTMQLQQEISNVTSGSGSLTPTISKRRIESTISVVSGQTVLLGGLISASRSTGRSGIPGLSRIPGVGGLFSKTSKSQQRTELIVLIRPVVVHNGEDAQSVAEDLRARLWAIGDRDLVAKP